jgi:hypothetical protein
LWIFKKEKGGSEIYSPVKPASGIYEAENQQTFF